MDPKDGVKITVRTGVSFYPSGVHASKRAISSSMKVVCWMCYELMLVMSRVTALVSLIVQSNSIYIISVSLFIVG